jgi:TatD DNase family protein
VFEMIDFHCHPDLYNDNFKLIEKSRENNFKIVAMTNLPQLYRRYYEKFFNEETINISLGYHPQLIEEYPNELNIFLKYVKEASFIGEVGLDISSKKTNNIELQKEIFRSIINECTRLGNKIISIHSRKTDDIIFDFLKKSSCIYIMHWYTGNIKRLLTAMSSDDNIYISINSNMVHSSNGIKLIETVPLSRIVLETDAPFTAETKNGYPKDILMETTVGISKIKKCEFKFVMEVIMENSKKIIQSTC